MPKLDPNTTEFRAAAHAAVDWIADYFDHIDDYPVLSRLQPGDTEKQFAAAASESGKPYDALMAELREKILPGITHWNHPSFMAYFSITGSQAGVIGELLSAALNINGMLWRTSPSVTELETLVLRWLRDALGLPTNLFGIINDTASINVFLALAAAREFLGLDIRGKGMTGRELPPLKVYLSELTHSSAEKAALALGFGQQNVVKIPVDDALRMRPDVLEAAIARDRAAGAIPCVIVATVGTTSFASVDPIRALGELAAREKIWYHVDTAYAGSAMICPELREQWDGIELADSMVVNPHKWLFTQVDCSVLYTRRPDVLRETFSLVPEYLKTTDTAEVNYMDYGLQLGRRFRALKLWMVMEHYGLERMRAVIRDQIGFADRLAAELQKHDGVELLAPPSFSVVVFRKKNNDETMALLERINASGDVFVSHTKRGDDYSIRVAIGNGATEWRHVERILSFL
ncbi:MAG TPA: pyridoxal-dependent decarboxylase [Thermoanaerobaculia bacterium]|nr:pyridoxal-dependent decarboxylase [Thermoanaerobaculia bacterium]